MRRHAAAKHAQTRAADPVADGARVWHICSAASRCRAARRATCGSNAFAHPERDKRVAVGIVVLVALAAATSLAWTGRLTPPGAFDAIPQYWHDAADWLDEHNDRRWPRAGGAGRAVRHPGVGQQPRRTAAGARRQPLGCAGLDSADPAGDHPRRSTRCSACSPPAARRRAWRIPLPGKGFRTLWCATTWTRRRRARRVRCWCTAPSTVRRAWRRSRSSAIRSARARWRDSSPTAGCGPATPPWRSTGSTRPSTPAAPYLVDTDAMARVDGAPEVLLRLDETAPPARASRRWARCCSPPTRRSAGLPVPVGHRDRHSAGARNRLRPRRRPLVGDPDARRSAAHLQPRDPTIPLAGADTVYGKWTGGRLSVSSSAADSTALPNVAPATGPAAAIDGDSSTSWVSNALQSAIGQWLQVDFDHPVTNATITVTPERHRRRRAGPPHRGVDRQRHQHAALRRSRVSRSPRRCPTANRRGCGSPRRPPTTGPPGCSSASPTSPSPSTTPTATPIRSACATPCRSPGRLRIPLWRNGIWARNCSADRAARRAPTVFGAPRRWRCHRKSR